MISCNKSRELCRDCMNQLSFQPRLMPLSESQSGNCYLHLLFIYEYKWLKPMGSQLFTCGGLLLKFRLLHLLNPCWLQCKIPKKWSVAKVIQLMKKGRGDSCESYSGYRVSYKAKSQKCLIKVTNI